MAGIDRDGKIGPVITTHQKQPKPGTVQQGKMGSGLSVTRKEPAGSGIRQNKSVKSEERPTMSIEERSVQPGNTDLTSRQHEDIIRMIEMLRPGQVIEKEDRDKIIKAVLDKQQSAFEVIKKVLEIDKDLSDISKKDLDQMILTHSIPIKELTGDYYQRGKSKEYLRAIKKESCASLVKRFSESRKKVELIFQMMKRVNNEITEHQAYEIIIEAQKDNLSAYDVIERALRTSDKYNDIADSLQGIVLGKAMAIKNPDSKKTATDSGSFWVDALKKEAFFDFLDMDISILEARQKDRKAVEAAIEKNKSELDDSEQSSRGVRYTIKQAIKPETNAYTWVSVNCANTTHIESVNPDEIFKRVINNAVQRCKLKEKKVESFLKKLKKERIIHKEFAEVINHSQQKKYGKMRAALNKISLYEFFKGVSVLENPGQDFFSYDKGRELLDAMIVQKYDALDKELNPSTSRRAGKQEVRASAPIGKLCWSSMTHSQCEKHLKIIKKIEKELIKCISTERADPAPEGLTRFLRPEQFIRLNNLLSEWKKIKPVDLNIPVRHQLEEALSSEEKLVQLNVLRKLFPIHEQGSFETLTVNGKKRKKAVTTYDGALSKQVAAVLQHLPQGENIPDTLRAFVNSVFSEKTGRLKNSEKPDDPDGSSEEYQ